MRALRLTSIDVVAGLVAVAVVVLAATGHADSLEYRRALLATEPWRAVSAHLVHLNPQHAIINALALLVVARLFAPDLDALRQGVVLLITAIVISAGLALWYPAIAWYRGLSGVVHGLFFAGATAWLFRERPRTFAGLWLPLALVVGGWIKVLFEQPAGETLPHADWLGAAVVPQAHLIGAACGTVLGLGFALAQPRRQPQRGKQEQLQQR